MEKYDLIILGTGPAGLTAQVYALRYNMKVLSIGGVMGGLMVEPHKICNWPGKVAISGQELTASMLEQVKAMNGEVVLDMAETLTKIEDGWQVETKGKKKFLAKKILLAMGTEHRKLNVPGEVELMGKGVTYCATCDAMFYRNKITAVAGGGNSAMTAALYLADICEKVYLIYRGDELKGEQVWKDEIANNPKIIKIKDTQVVELKGEVKLEKVVLDKSFENESELAVSGIFIEVGTKPKTEIFKNAGGEVDEGDRIKVKIDQSTSLPNVWAAGDITNGSNGFRQILTACAEGAVAVESIHKTIQAKI
jgi:thioredoxin reductase (NADPH)